MTIYDELRICASALVRVLTQTEIYKPKDKVLLVYLSNTEHYCAHLKMKRTNLRSSGRGTTGLYTFSRWSMHHCLVCVQWNVLEQVKIERVYDLIM
jgi:hypothetical protein